MVSSKRRRADEERSGDVATESVTLAGRAIPYTRTISHRARHPRLIIAPGMGLRVVTPVGYDPHRIVVFIRRRQGWILKHLDRIAALPAEPDAGAPLPGSIPFLGAEHAIHVVVLPGRRATVRLDGQAFTVMAPEEGAARPALEAWLRDAARFAIVTQVE